MNSIQKIIIIKINLTLVLFVLRNTAGSGTEFIDSPLTSSFPAGSTRACVNFAILDDTLALEGDETFTATFETPDGFISVKPSTATVTILDDDGMYSRQII